MKWIEPFDVHVPADLAAAVGGHPLVAQTLVRRGLAGIQQARAFLDAQLYEPVASAELPDLVQAAERLELALQRREKILVWGDFDVDGQTATALLVSALRDLAGRADLVAYHIPVRERESHGVNVPLLQEILDEDQASLPQAPKIKLLLTCDTGVTAHAAVAYAQERGVEVLITDHHELPEQLPLAMAVVNPRRLPSGPPLHALATLPGVGVAYKLVEELYRRAGKAGEEKRLLDLVALGIVADVAELVGETRYLLQCGLKALRQSPRVGLQALYELAELNPASLTEEHIGFLLAPRLNAMGRLGDANPVVELLITRDDAQARLLALQLEGMNSRRKFLSNQVFQAAMGQIRREPALLEGAILVLAHPTWHAGVIGIVASRLVERFHKPTVLIATPPGEPARGSARSVAGVNIIAALNECKHLFLNVGGHAMAAGFSIQAERITELRRALSAVIEKAGPLPEATLTVDAYVKFEELSLEFVDEIERLAPFGAGNPPLTLACRDVKVVASAPVGREEEHLVITLAPAQKGPTFTEAVDGEPASASPAQSHAVTQRVIWWQGGPFRHELPVGPFDLAYSVRASTYHGQRDLQLEWLDSRLSPSAQPEAPVSPIQLIADHRQQPHPLAWLEKYLALPDIQVWVEGAGRAQLVERYPSQASLFRSRYELQPGDTLLVWTTPPAVVDWQNALSKVAPRQLVLVAVDPEMDQPEAFLTRLAGLAKYTLKHNRGVVTLDQLATATAQTTWLVEKGLAWLAAQGNLAIVERQGDQFCLAAGNQPDASLAGKLILQIQELMDETRAFRAFFIRAEPDSLIY